MNAPIIDAVVIGRNEGARLIECIDSLKPQVRRVIYVDSGSSDMSPELAQKAGAEVVNLDMKQPFTAARARNAGLARLSDTEFVQFVDGDCIVHPDWVAHARDFIINHPDIAAVCGRRREEFPNASVYNRLCDDEWNTPVGTALACGGDSLMRMEALQQVGGFQESLIAGEEPDLCLRLREMNWKVHRIDSEMTLHDANIMFLSQWLKRCRRAGYAFAEGSLMHGWFHWGRETLRALIWGMGLPLLVLLFAQLSPLAWLLLLIYPAQVIRIAWKRGGHSLAWEQAFFLVLSKFPEAWGVLTYYSARLRKKTSAIIEYK